MKLILWTSHSLQNANYLRERRSIFCYHTICGWNTCTKLTNQYSDHLNSIPLVHCQVVWQQQKSMLRIVSNIMKGFTLRRNRHYTRRFCPSAKPCEWAVVRANCISIKPERIQFSLEIRVNWIPVGKKPSHGYTEIYLMQISMDELQYTNELNFTCFKCWRRMSVLIAPRRERRERVPR